MRVKMKERLLNTLVCPKCHGQLHYIAETKQLVCQTDKLSYSIKEGIPVLLESEATAIQDDRL